MTNEDIEKKAAALVSQIETDDLLDGCYMPLGGEARAEALIAQAVRELVVQAYEEAAGVFEAMCSARVDFDSQPLPTRYPACGACFYCGKAKEVRALKDSLVQETASTS